MIEQDDDSNSLLSPDSEELGNGDESASSSSDESVDK